MAHEGRRQDVGTCASAALPVLWRIIALRGWSHARLAQELEEDTGKISKLLYGDRKPGRKLSVKLRDLGIAIELWDEPLTDNWSPSHRDLARSA